MKNPFNVVAAVGLALGGVFGMVETVITQRNLQAASWRTDGVALVVATALLILKFFRSGNDVVAAGFLVFAIGEGLILSGTATTLAGSVPSFAAGAALWSVALLLTSVPREFSVWARVWQVRWLQFFLRSLRQGSFGGNRCCQPHRRCPSLYTPSSC